MTTTNHFDGNAEFAARGARSGSAFSNDRDYRRPIIFPVLVFRAVRDLLAVCALLAFALLAYSYVSEPPRPTLVGNGCDGASAPLYAFEESDFPPCVAIAAR